MKTFKHILPFLLALLVLAGCEDDVNYTQGTAENPDCYGVYFPKKQATRTDLEFEPGTQTEATYTVKRRNTVDPIVVPVVVKSNVEDIFVVEPIAFDAGEDETTFTISFPGAQMGTTYTCDINIEDPRYASIYGADKVNLSISLVLAKWELVTDEKTGETKGRYRDDILGNFASIDNPNANPNPEIELEIYERSDKKGYYRMKAYTPELMNIFAGGQVNHENRNVWTYVDASDPNKVYYPYQSTGLTLFADMGEWYIASQTPENFAMDESAGQYGTLKNGVITFPAQGIVLEPSEGEYAGKFFYANANGLQRIMLPGARVYDYSVALTKSEPADGVVEIGATLSEDTREFRYAIFTGNLSDGEASLKAQEMADGKIAAELIKTITASGTISVQDLEGGTGKYTLVGCIYGSDEEANPEGGETASQNLKMQGYASISFGYIAKGDEDKVSVILNIGLEATNEFAGQGITTDNAAKFWAYGEGIESVKHGVFKTKDIQGLDMTAFLKEEGKDFTKEQLDAINGGHYSVMLTGLNGDTEYTFAGLAYNGYASKLFTASIKTTGKYNPGLESEFLYSDFLPQKEQPSKEYLISTEWNYYAVNVMDEKPMRRKIGTVTIEDDPAARQFGRSADHHGTPRGRVRRRRSDSGGLRSLHCSARRHNRRYLPASFANADRCHQRRGHPRRLRLGGEPRSPLCGQLSVHRRRRGRRLHLFRAHPELCRAGGHVPLSVYVEYDDPLFDPYGYVARRSRQGYGRHSRTGRRADCRIAPNGRRTPAAAELRRTARILRFRRTRFRQNRTDRLCERIPARIGS